MNEYKKIQDKQEFFKINKALITTSDNDFKQYYIKRIDNVFLFWQDNNIVVLKAVGKMNYFNIKTLSNNLVAKINKLRINNKFYLKCNYDLPKTILFGQYKKGFSHPRKIWAIIPKIRLSCAYEKRLLDNYINNSKKYVSHPIIYKKNIIYLINKPPIFDRLNKINMLTLHQGRMSSVKNFQLIIRKKIVFELGKLSSSDYSVRFRYPFSILQAFGMALTAF